MANNPYFGNPQNSDSNRSYELPMPSADRINQHVVNPYGPDVSQSKPHAKTFDHPQNLGPPNQCPPRGYDNHVPSENSKNHQPVYVVKKPGPYDKEVTLQGEKNACAGCGNNTFKLKKKAGSFVVMMCLLIFCFTCCLWPVAFCIDTWKDTAYVCKKCKATNQVIPGHL